MPLMEVAHVISKMQSQEKSQVETDYLGRVSQKEWLPKIVHLTQSIHVFGVSKHTDV